MLFMVIERFKPGTVLEIYRRLREPGPIDAGGLSYEGSWIGGSAGAFS